MTNDPTLFLVLLFFAIVFISQALILPAAGQRAKHKELAARLRETKDNLDEESKSLLQEHYNKGLTGFEKQLIKFSVFEDFRKVIELSGTGWAMGKTLGITFLISVISAMVCVVSNQTWYVTVAAPIFVWLVMYMYLNSRITKRLMQFEEQLPEALDIIKRVLQAGQPLNQSFYEVGTEMPPPIGIEFRNTFNLLNFGYDLRLAILQMVDRSPTVSMMAFASAVLLQKETGGNLTENLDKVSNVLRARFKLSRKIRTLSAEARMSAWILVLAPFALFGMLMVINPTYAQVLYQDPRGLNMVSVGIVLLAIGAFWIRQIINIRI
ncbi:type II secretion system F family protein [Vibrio sp. JC009]|uniref:type II secretion system F family protein n=1 Tax=Vibrio sp. JC009 TaxID=2912314 RepID=UPI0023AEDDA8|nr:type II secretion system F family protein [Vibrio sp. JC009]WED21272.1 type II secretion system F family protein [Vibrio sp. JC009]